MKWVSGLEVNIAKYQVQHSNDGIKFTDIAGAVINAKNTSASYSFTDNAPFKKFNYYRLKIIDISGLVTSGKVAVVNNGNNISLGYISIFPNPAVNFLNIQTKAGQKGKAEVSITSSNGQTVYKSDYTIAEESIINLDAKKFSAGHYFVRIATADGETTNLPFIKY